MPSRRSGGAAATDGPGPDPDPGPGPDPDLRPGPGTLSPYPKNMFTMLHDVCINRLCRHQG